MSQGFEISDKIFDVFAHFDSSINDYLPIPWTFKRKWIGTIDYIYFEPTGGGQYADPTAYLHVKMNNLLQTSTSTQTGKFPGKGMIFPIVRPHTTTPVIKSYAKGLSYAEDLLTFDILDKNLDVVDTQRIVLTMHVFADDGRVLTL